MEKNSVNRGEDKSAMGTRRWEMVRFGECATDCDGSW